MAIDKIQYPAEVIDDSEDIPQPALPAVQPAGQQQPLEQPQQPPAEQAQAQELQQAVPGNENELEVCKLLCLASYSYVGGFGLQGV